MKSEIIDIFVEFKFKSLSGDETKEKSIFYVTKSIFPFYLKSLLAALKLVLYVVQLSN